MKSKPLTYYCECGGIMLELAHDESTGHVKLRCSSRHCDQSKGARFVKLQDVEEVVLTEEESKSGAPG